MRYSIITICLIICSILVSCSEEKKQNAEERPFMRTVDDNPPHTFYRNDISVPEEMRSKGPEFEIVKVEDE